MSSKSYIKKVAGDKLVRFITNNSNFSQEKIFYLLYNMKISSFLSERGFRAITFKKFMFLFDDFDLKKMEKNEIRDSLFIHEFTHVIQQRIIGLFLFLIRYIYQYFKNYSKTRNTFTAYAMITYEIEARATEIRLLHYDDEVINV